MEAKRWWIPIARAGLSIKRSKELLLLALFGPRAMSDLSPECAPKQTSADRSELMGSRSGSSHSLLFAAANLCENKSFHRVQKLPRFAQQRLNLPSLGDRSSGEQAVLARVPVSPWRAGSRRAAVHAAAIFAAHRRRAARAAATDSCAATRARQHRSGIAGMVAHAGAFRLASTGSRSR